MTVVSLLRPENAPLPLTQILGERDEVFGDQVSAIAESVLVSGITLDSRLVAPGDLYVALPGTRAHGAAYATQAVAQGAVAVLTDPSGAEQASAAGVPVLVIDDPRSEMANLAAVIYRRPAERMKMFAVTGTNGKTTTAFMLSAALRQLGHHTGTIGTIGFLLDDARLEGTRTTVTTPESVDLQGLLGLMAEKGADSVAMEVSSHAMALHRADGICFDVAAFVNLARDHLDFHHTMEEYFEAKASLFTPEHAKAAVINVDDPYGRRLAERVRAAGDLTVRTFCWPEPDAEADADYCILGVEDSQVTVATPTGEWRFVLNLPGDYNVRNAVTALAMIELAGLDATTAMAGMAKVTVPGRMQPVDLGPDAPEVFVDFAHTPEAIVAAMSAFATRREAGRTVVAVVGCGGDRDNTKRAPMGAAAAAGADFAVITDDNPRSEEPALIRAAALEGARSVHDQVIDGGDRRSAIRRALELAGPQGVVAVLGKGHEQGQQIKDVLMPFDDVTVVREEWAALQGAASATEREDLS